jgi:hypothetical protein
MYSLVSTEIQLKIYGDQYMQEMILNVAHSYCISFKFFLNLDFTSDNVLFEVDYL